MKTFRQFAILGSGRLARHLAHYFSTLKLPFVQWSRHDRDAEEQLRRAISDSSHILLAVVDDALTSVIERVHRNFDSDSNLLVHFSGAKYFHDVPCAHPLMTFGESLESADWYQSIPFVMDEGYQLADLLPNLPNPWFTIKGEERPLYHALCALAGNSTYLLWRQMGELFEQRLKLPRHLMAPYLHQTVRNALEATGSNFTGPIARRDWNTVRKHLEVLEENKAFQKFYRGYLELARNEGITLPGDLI